MQSIIDADAVMAASWICAAFASAAAMSCWLGSALARALGRAESSKDQDASAFASGIWMRQADAHFEAALFLAAFAYAWTMLMAVTGQGIVVGRVALAAAGACGLGLLWGFRLGEVLSQAFGSGKGPPSWIRPASRVVAGALLLSSLGAFDTV